jgi:hypothetical protein
MTTSKAAGKIVMGDRLIEGGVGGMIWQVDAVSREGRDVVLTINPEFGDMLICRPDRDQTRRFRKTTKLYVETTDATSNR